MTVRSFPLTLAVLLALGGGAAAVEHRTRALAYRQAMEQLAARYPDDREAAVFYALALNATALPTDKTYADQLRAAGILEKVFAAEPQHPGVAHYLIHSYDYPPIAEKGLTAAPRYALERGRWSEAAGLALFGKEFPWGRFPQSEAQLVFARALGAARSGYVAATRRDIDRLAALRDALAAAKVGYWAEQVDIQHAVASAWMARAEGKQDEALALLRAAADREGATEKHPVTPGPLAPARELLAEMLLEAGEPGQALQEFEASMRVEPNRFRGLAGAARAANLAGDRTKARSYYSELLALGEKADAERPELREARAFLGK